MHVLQEPGDEVDLKRLKDFCDKIISFISEFTDGFRKRLLTPWGIMILSVQELDHDCFVLRNKTATNHHRAILGNCPGVYVFFSLRSGSIYVGKSKTLMARVLSHVRKDRYAYCFLHSPLKGKLDLGIVDWYVILIPTKDYKISRALENFLIYKLEPDLNKG